MRRSVVAASCMQDREAMQPLKRKPAGCLLCRLVVISLCVNRRRTAGRAVGGVRGSSPCLFDLRCYVFFKVS